MIKKKFRIPRGEIVRDYHKFSEVPNVRDVILAFEYEELNEDGDEEVLVVGRSKDSFVQ